MRLMDQLGLAAGVVEVGTLKRWSFITPLNHMTDYSGSGTDDCKHSSSPFPYDMLVNQKLILWVGDISQLNVDAIVNSTNESMTERNPTSDRIVSKAGPGLGEEITNDVKECRTGEVRVTQGYNLPARFVIHTVGPKYNVKYQTAAENTLHLCYRTVLQKACELGLSSIAIGVINSVRRNYPPDEGAHIALRTVRRFLEQPGSSLETVVLVVQSVDVGIYEVLVPLYFPRSPLEEENARWQLPLEVGGPNGEPVQPDRLIRIIDNPQHTEQGEDSTNQSDNALSITSHAFCEMQGDLDKQRLLGERPTSNPLDEFIIKEMQSKERYERLLRQAKKEDLSEVSGIGCLYQSGFDRKGRPVIVFVGKWFRFREVNLDIALLYLISLLDPLVKGDYAIAYFHTLTSNANHPSLGWLREVYNVLPYKYKKHLKAFYIVHPTFWTKMVTWWFTTFMAPAIKQKVHSLPGVEHLYAMMAPDQLEIPAFITEYDMSMNGLRYFQPTAPT